MHGLEPVPDVVQSPAERTRPLVAVKRLCIGRIEPGIYPLESWNYLRHWFLSYLLTNTRSILMPLYATVYLPTVLRWLGAKIGS